MIRVRLARRLTALLPRHPVRVGAFIIGATKSGTSALFSYLGLHPSCVPSRLKEVSYFNNPVLYARGVEWYHAQFPARLYQPWRDYRFLDASPNYLDEEETARRIHAYNRDALLLVLLRDPVVKSFSLWNHWHQSSRRPAHEKLEDFDRYIRGFPDAERWWDLMNAETFPSFRQMAADSMRAIEVGEGDRFPNVLSGAIYADQVAAYLRHFPRTALHAIQTERFHRERVRTLEEVTRFLRLPPLAWETRTLPAVHERPYEDTLPADVEALLREFYRPYNERLWNVLGEEYDWPAPSP